MMLTTYMLRRHRPTPDADYFYEIVKLTRAFPLAVPTESHLAVVHSEKAGTALVKELCEQREEGVIEGMTRFAWWNDGEQFVGTCGTTLKQAVEDLKREPRTS